MSAVQGDSPGSAVARCQLYKDTARVICTMRQPGVSCTRRQPGVSCTRRQPGVSCTRRQPGVSCTRRQPGVSCTKRQPGVNCTRRQSGVSCTRRQPSVITPCPLSAFSRAAKDVDSRLTIQHANNHTVTQHFRPKSSNVVE